jgi:sterol desaturase/sphingolipid hydroxylase (fatty acid hydroxylase superfamily)
MSFIDALILTFKGLLPILPLLYLALIPFIVLEQLRPIGQAPRWSDYGSNIALSLIGIYLSLPFGIAAGMWSARLRELLPWKPLSFNFDSIGSIPYAGPALEILVMIFVPLLMHDMWFYWSHRLEHKVPILWEFHKLHHSDERMSTASWARDHFLQSSWRAFFSVFTLGLFLDLDLAQAGKAVFYSNLFLFALSMFYHSAIRVRVPGLNRLLVTPQVHRIHHSKDPAHFNTNFADALPLFDILFGTYRHPGKEEFPPTGLEDFPAPRSLWSAQFGPLLAIGKMLLPKRSAPG